MNSNQLDCSGVREVGIVDSAEAGRRCRDWRRNGHCPMCSFGRGVSLPSWCGGGASVPRAPSAWRPSQALSRPTEPLQCLRWRLLHLQRAQRLQLGRQRGPTRLQSLRRPLHSLAGRSGLPWRCGLASGSRHLQRGEPEPRGLSLLRLGPLHMRYPTANSSLSHRPRGSVRAKI
jgi:hypothetical protein